MNSRIVFICFFAMPCILCTGTLAGEADADILESAPVVILPDWKGEYVSFASFYSSGSTNTDSKIKVVMINFIGLNCPPCEVQLPLFLEVARAAVTIAPETIKYFLIATDSWSFRDELAAYLREKGVELDSEVLVDPYKKAAEKFGVRGIPRTFVISHKGEIVDDIHGAVSDYKQRLKKATVQAYNSGKSISREELVE